MLRDVLRKINDEYVSVIEEVPDEEVEQIIDDRPYEEKLRDLVHQKYSIDDECAILRKKLAGIDNGEFAEYNSYVESCKSQLKGE